MKALGEFHDLKSNMLEEEERIISGIKGDTSEGKNFQHP